MAKRWRRRMGVMILCSMAGTTLMLALQGRIREAVPLHLCSVSALAAAALAFSPAPFVVDFLWLLGMPGAVLALVFPAPAVSRWQTAFTACYVLTHALIVLIGWPLRRFLPTARSERIFCFWPRRRPERRWRKSIA